MQHATQASHNKQLSTGVGVAYVTSTSVLDGNKTNLSETIQRHQVLHQQGDQQYIIQFKLLVSNINGDEATDGASPSGMNDHIVAQHDGCGLTCPKVMQPLCTTGHV